MTNSSPAAGSLARRLVLPELAKLTKGRLVLRLPEGAELVLGDPRATGGARMEIRDENAFRRIMLAADIGLTEGYMEGEWDSPDLNALIGFFIENIDQTPGMSGSARKALGVGLFRIADRIGHLLRPNDKQMVRRNISEHYDVSNDFFRLFLDPSMMYSSARWEGTDSLEQAQTNKNDSLCRFLQLKPTDHVIEIGTGWGRLGPARRQEIRLPRHLAHHFTGPARPRRRARQGRRPLGTVSRSNSRTSATTRVRMTSASPSR